MIEYAGHRPTEFYTYDKNCKQITVFEHSAEVRKGLSEIKPRLQPECTEWADNENCDYVNHVESTNLAGKPPRQPDPGSTFTDVMCTDEQHAGILHDHDSDTCQDSLTTSASFDMHSSTMAPLPPQHADALDETVIKNTLAVCASCLPKHMLPAARRTPVLDRYTPTLRENCFAL